ncbi:hypothetical protein [Pseudomonas sp. LTJR-52]|uniref:hypothetical protein n=1 Tax=Pseudomonas sp. LTJR-52 TaxID=2479392 RepID=UPI0013CEAC38|nr:hypothetical protein [Pseudomonas sp. LTJR-52]
MPKIYSYYFEELVFKFTFDLKDGAGSPEWRESEEFPPLPPRLAITASRVAILEMLRAYPYAEPEFHSCALKRASEFEGAWWYYEIDWMVWPPDEGDRSGVNVPVMLNGQIPSYEVFKYEDRASAWRA